MNFKITSPFKPTGDQPAAIEELSKNILNGETNQILLGATGSGKTFTIANVVEKIQRPTLVLCHNKTLAAQLYAEFKSFFPENAVEYFISYYDYYQPEAYIVSSDIYIEKDLSINQEIEKLRLKATSSLLSGRRDVLVVASVSCIYGMGNPEEFSKGIVTLKVNDEIGRNTLLFKLVDILYNRTESEFLRGTFRVKGDTIDIYPAYADFAYRLIFWGDEIEEIHRIEPDSGKKITSENQIVIFPANLFVTGKDVLQVAIKEIQDDLVAQLAMFEREGKFQEAKRLKEKTELDLEMMRELGYCTGIENYSRYFDRRKQGTRPFCLLDYFPDDFLLVVDESHVSLPQVRAMWGGDRSRKVNLVEYGFRLPSAMDNRPLTFQEFENITNQVIYVSATPGDYELSKTEGVVVQQIIRPTGLLDPTVDIRSTQFQIDDLLNEINKRVIKNERVLVTTLTKRLSEHLHEYLSNLNIPSRYLHSEIDALERIEILHELRNGDISVLVGVNLLREGLDLPEVSLVAILDADKEGFLRDKRSLIQTMGRAARNSNGHVIFYADKITQSMQAAIDETTRRRAIQMEYNHKHNITPTTIIKENLKTFENNDSKSNLKYGKNSEYISIAAESIGSYKKEEDLVQLAEKIEKEMKRAAKNLDFLEAARLRDEWLTLKEKIAQK